MSVWLISGRLRKTFACRRRAVYLALGALTVLGFLGPAAQAEAAPGLFTRGETPLGCEGGKIEGSQEGGPTENYFEAFGERIGCTEEGVAYAAETETGRDSALSLTPSYTKCWTLEGGELLLPVTVEMNGCHYDLDQPQPAEGGGYTGTAGLLCPEGEQVEIHFYLFGNEEEHSVQVCLIGISPAAGTSHVAYANLEGEGESKDRIAAEATLGGIHAERSGTCGQAETSEASLHGNVILASSGHDVWVED